MTVDDSEGDINVSPERAKWQKRHLNDDTQKILEEDARYFMHQALSSPCLNVLADSEASCFEDIEGRRYLDFHGNSAHQIGYKNSTVIDAIKAQLDTLPFSPRRYTNEPAIRLAKRLTKVAPMDEARILFAPGGAEVNSMALQYARQATGRFKTISFWESFHGGTLDTISVGGEAIFRSGAGPLMPGAFHVPPPGANGSAWEESVAQIEYVMEHEGDIASIIAEPIRCTNMHQPPAAYWQAVRDLCDRNGTLLIFDEIPIGLGRSGYMFCCEYANIAPDILTLGKGLGGGVLPLAAMIARADLNVAGDRAIGHFTHEKSPVACAAGNAVLDAIENDSLVQRAVTQGDRLTNGLKKLIEKHSRAVSVRGLGLLIALELDAPSSQFADRLLYRCLELGLNFKTSGGRYVILTPPLTVSDEEVDEAIVVLDSALTDLGGEST